ncbi:MAG TPA: alpha-hydroxy acid oxidase [Xanthobacteraceae bacterium]|nr:alpha-hydroxy acid oxidase [Xanthobacteraceae bacterium]
MFRAVRDGRSPHARPAPCRHQERADRSSAPDRTQCLRHRHETRLAHQGVAGSAQDLRECRGLSQGPRRDREGRAWSNQNFDRSLNWRDVEWVRSLWPGKLVLKGVLDVEDAKTAASAGVDGIVVSNHGGRQLDGAHSTIRVLPDIASAVGDRIEVLFDGGIRSGHDVLKALARGAHGCLIGRAYLYGLAANGEAGVRQALDIIRAELEVALTLTGTRDVRAVTREVIG